MSSSSESHGTMDNYEPTVTTQTIIPSEELLPDFSDDRVQAVYAILCDTSPPPEGEHWEGFCARRIVARTSSAVPAAGRLDPDMPAQELRLHMGEMTAQELRTARAAIRWANSTLPSTEPSEVMVEFLVDIERRLMNAQPAIGAADNASFIDNHLEPVFALLKEVVGERSCQHASAPSGLAALNESQGK